jgi:hypothetical protein
VAVDQAWLVASGHFLEDHVFGRLQRMGEAVAFVPLPP